MSETSILDRLLEDIKKGARIAYISNRNTQYRVLSLDGITDALTVATQRAEAAEARRDVWKDMLDSADCSAREGLGLLHCRLDAKCTVCSLRAERDALRTDKKLLEDACANACAAIEKLEAECDALRGERDALRQDATMLREFVSSDEIAMTYQTMRQYRAALLMFLAIAVASLPTTGEGA